MKIIDYKDAINRRLYEGLMIVETPIYEPARCGVARGLLPLGEATALRGFPHERLPKGFADLRELAWGGGVCSDWRRVSSLNRTILGLLGNFGFK